VRGFKQTLINEENFMLKTLYIMQQAAQEAPEMKEAVKFSVGLVIVCLLVLILLWLPALLKQE